MSRVSFTKAQVRRAVQAAESAGSRTFVYFLRAGEFVKIGQSRRWKIRMHNMQTGSPYTIVPLLVLAAEPRLEKKLHNRFRSDHFRGEWFHMGPAIVAFIKENLINCVAKSELDNFGPSARKGPSPKENADLAASWDDAFL